PGCPAAAPPVEQVAGRVISSIRTRRDSLTDARFDFLPVSFFPEILRHFPGFEDTTTKAGFSFSPALHCQFMYRPQWFTKVDYLYSPVIIRDTHWVGVIVDLKMWATYVVDSNPACPSEFVVNSVLTPISILLPHLISRYCLTTHTEVLDYLPLPISRLDLPLLVEQPGYSAVVALILLETHVVGKEVTCVYLSEEHLRAAAENYAIATLAMCKAGSLPEA
ncbi:hypothetical protein N665_0158s0007, partial [Sinapis alba]